MSVYQKKCNSPVVNLDSFVTLTNIMVKQAINCSLVPDAGM